MNSKQKNIKENWNHLTKNEKRELLLELYNDSDIIVSIEEAKLHDKSSSTMNFGSVIPCPTCGK